MKKIILSIGILIAVLLLLLFLHPYLLMPKYGFPVVKTEFDIFSTHYLVCKDESTQERVYVRSSAGEDTSFENYYEADGNLVESGEFGPGTVYNREPKIKTKDCLRTTKLYFIAKTK